MPIPMQPPPYYANFLDDSGHISEIWKRFFLATQTSIQFLLQTQQRIGNQQGPFLPLEDLPDVGFIFTTPPGPSSPASPSPGTAGINISVPFVPAEAPDDPPWLMPGLQSLLATVNQILYAGSSGVAQGSSLWTFDGVTVTETETGAAAITASATPPRLQLIMKNSTNWGFTILNTTYSTLVDNGVQLWQDNLGFLQAQTGGSFIFNFSPTGNMNVLLAVRAFQSTAIPAGGTIGTGYLFSNVTNFGVFFGSGTPTLSAAQGSVYLQSDGAAGSRTWVNTNGTTGWERLASSYAPSTVAGLPAGVQGIRSFVTDATATTFASNVAGGGTNKVPVVFDGTNWIIG